MKKTILTLGVALLTVISVIAQEGKPAVKVFSNFNYNLTTVEGETAFKEFEIKRAYLGYQYNFDDKLSAKITFDVGADDGGGAGIYPMENEQNHLHTSIPGHIKSKHLDT